MSETPSSHPAILPVTHVPATRPGSPFSAATAVAGVLYLSGQIGVDSEGRLAEGMEAQTRQTMENVRNVLASQGLGLEHVFKCTVMLADISQWAAFNRVYLSYFDAARLPSRSGFGVNGLVAGALVELECWAVGPA